jgi:hypothetical protein
VNDRSIGSWRRFESELAPHLTTLEHALTAGGYRP